MDLLVICRKFIVLDHKNISGFQVSDRADCNIEIERDDFLSGDVLLSRLKNCVVKIIGSPSTVHITDLDNCKVLSGPVKTSVFVERCNWVIDRNINISFMYSFQSFQCVFFVLTCQILYVEMVETKMYWSWSKVLNLSRLTRLESLDRS